MQRDPYRVLGVPPGASPAVVVDAYRRLSKLHHPDREGGTSERFVEIQRAYETLRARPAPDTTLEERLAALDLQVREAAARKPARDARADFVVRDVNDLVEGLDGLSSKLDGLYGGAAQREERRTNDEGPGAGPSKSGDGGN